MPVDEPINLDGPDGLTEEDIQRMNEEADKLEEIAKNAEKNKDKIEDAKKSLEGLNFAQLNILEKSMEGSPQGGAGMSRDQMLDMMIDVLKELETGKKEREENKKTIKTLSEKQDEISKKIDKLKKNMEKTFKDFEGGIRETTNQLSSFRRGPTGFVTGLARNKAFQFLGKAGVYGAVAQFMLEMGEQIYQEMLGEIKSMFEPGGLLDVRKESLDNMKQIANLDHMIQVHRGEVFFTSDTAEVLRQGAPLNSNTREKVNGHKQYLQEFDE